jgi:hypothetical protein
MAKAKKVAKPVVEEAEQNDSIAISIVSVVVLCIFIVYVFIGMDTYNEIKRKHSSIVVFNPSDVNLDHSNAAVPGQLCILVEMSIYNAYAKHYSDLAKYFFNTTSNIQNSTIESTIPYCVYSRNAAIWRIQSLLRDFVVLIQTTDIVLVLPRNIKFQCHIDVDKEEINVTVRLQKEPFYNSSSSQTVK